MSYKHITVNERDGGEVTEIVMGPPPANILSSAMMEEISTHIGKEETDPHKKLLIFTGDGKHFSFGASVEEHKAENVGDMLPKFHAFIGDVINCKVPTLAAVSGLCLGGAFELVLACDLIFAEKGAQFAVPEIQLGVFPPVASVLLPFKCGGTLASEVILTGDRFAAETLHSHGLVNHVAESGKLEEVISSFIEKEIHPKSASSLRITKAASSMVLAEQYQNHIGRLEDLYLKDLMSTTDAVEGIEAFLEKRQPDWKDK
ncbi:MAG: enoyl-CoA hydratase/isomerase family protein [bacterium]|nr:MAG: enoyl-CoA hydratase/isomerase family protein [bacterium]